MILGMSTATFTLLHVVISLIAIVSGLIVMAGFLVGNRLNRLTSLFLLTTALTSVTGFFFPVEHVMPSHILGIMSLVVLAIAIPARYVFRMLGAWRPVYVIGAAFALYVNVFVLVVQSFQKIPALKALAPTQKESPFLVAQLVVLLAFITISILATKRFKPEQALAV